MRAVIRWVLPLLPLFLGILPLLAQTPYSIGEPTDEEQLYLEYINRARVNPAAEGARLATTTDSQVLSAYSYFGVDLTMMQSEFSALSAAPPLSMNANLLAAARGHSADSAANFLDAHTGSNGSSPWTRINAQGYSYTTARENVFAYSKSNWYGHAGFQVDWGTGSGGMQTGRGHRVAIHDAALREVGIGIVNSTPAPGWGPQFVTQDFATAQGATPIVTGVAYFDLNANSFYDVGEGMGGVTVTVPGTTVYAVTSASGGYSIPVPGNGSYPATFSPAHAAAVVVPGTVASLKNVKADLVLAYARPVLTPPAAVYVGSPAEFSFNTTPGARAHQLRIQEVVTPASEGAENGSTGLTIVANGGYSVIQGNIKDTGSKAFHLAHTAWDEESITLERTLSPRSGGAMSFRSRLRYATTGETAKAQVTDDGGLTWQTLWSQAGTNGAGESSFNTRNVSLAAFAGKSIRVRFVFSISGGSYQNAGDVYGWFFDNISFTSVDEYVNAQTLDLGDVTSGSFVPAQAKTYAVDVRPRVGARLLPASSPVHVTAVVAPASSYVGWAVTAESANGLPAGSLSDRTADFDGDGMPNAMEFAFAAMGVNPAVFDSSLLPAPKIVGANMVLDYMRDTARTEVVVGCEASEDTAIWKTPGAAGAPAGFTDTLLSTNGTVQTRRASIPTTAARCFLRLTTTP